VRHDVSVSSTYPRLYAISRNVWSPPICTL